MSSLTGNEDYRNFMDKLALANVDRHIELPKIAVMGDTSSGKSSLLSSLAMVELPSSDQLTTRCPIMLQMSAKETKSATVAVSWKDRPPGKADDIDFGVRIMDESNWHELTPAIADAQEHIVKITGKEVARDVVVVKIVGPECENLTVIDLPGIVRSTGLGESTTLVNDIQALIDDYLKNPRCVILAVHPSNVDFHNSQIMADAKAVDPETKRTIPVLTKPDLIDDGAEQSVLDLLLGHKTETFKKGFHMVKGRGQKDLNTKTTIDQGLSAELAFFQNTMPWRGVQDRSLFGTVELRRKLGELQVQIVRTSFPAIVAEMKEQHAKTAEALKVLGDPPESASDRRMFFNGIKDRIVALAQSSLSGRRIRSSGGKAARVLSSTFHEDCTKLHETLRASRLANVAKPESDSASDSESDSESDWLLDMIKQNRPYGLPIFMPEDTFNRIVSDMMESEWLEPCYELVQSVSDLLHTSLDEALANDAGVCLFPRLRDFLATRLDPTIKDVTDESRKKVADFVKREQMPYTQNHYLSENIKRQRTKSLKDQLFKSFGLLPHYDDGNVHLTKAHIRRTLEGVFDKTERKSVDEHLADDMKHALDAYGKVAMKRFIDVVPMICGDMLLDFPSRMNEALSMVTDDELDRILTTSRDELTRRADLKRKISDLDEGLTIIGNLI